MMVVKYVALLLLLFLGGGAVLSILPVVLIIALIVRNNGLPATAHWLRRGWALVPIALIFGVFGLLFVRFASHTYSVSQSSSPVEISSASSPPLTSESEQARKRYVEAMRANRPASEINTARAKYIVALAKQSVSNRHSQQKDSATAQAGILAEMEQFDTPRIPLPPEAPEAPSAPTAAAAAQPSPAAEAEDKPADGDKASVISKQVDTKKSAPPSAQADKKPEKPPVVSSPEPPKSESKKTTKKPATSPSKPTIVAKANPDNSKTRPAWTNESSKRTGNTFREVITTDEYQSTDECYQAADIYLLLKTYQRIQELAGRPQANSRLPSLTFSGRQILGDDGQIIWEESEHGGKGWNDSRLNWLANMGIGADYARREIVAKDSATLEAREFVETVERSFGPMKKLYLQIEFTPAVDSDLRRHWESHYRQERLALFGIGAGSLLAFLGIVFAMLKVDTATKGYYTKRLFLGVPAAIIGALILLKFLDEYTSLL